MTPAPRPTPLAIRSIGMAALSILCAGSARADVPLDAPVPAPIQAVDVEERLGAALPLDLVFTDQDGRSVRLRDRLDGARPLVLALGYLDCPMLCPLILARLQRALGGLPWREGSDYATAFLSIAPEDTPAAAMRRRSGFARAAGLPAGSAAWPFLVGRAEDSRAVADALGFRYAKDPQTGQYAHAAVIFLVAPDGRVARYVYGVDFDPLELRLALADAAQGRAGPSIDRMILSCFRWDPASRKYRWFVYGLLRGGAALVLGALALTIVVLLRRERRAARAPLPGSEPGP